jgi:hypothetical protein
VLKIDTQTHTGGGRGGGGTSCTPSKDFEKFGHKMQWNTKIEDPLIFPHNPKYPPTKEFENNCASMNRW